MKLFVLFMWLLALTYCISGKAQNSVNAGKQMQGSLQQHEQVSHFMH